MQEFRARSINHKPPRMPHRPSLISWLSKQAQTPPKSPFSATAAGSLSCSPESMPLVS